MKRILFYILIVCFSWSIVHHVESLSINKTEQSQNSDSDDTSPEKTFVEKAKVTFLTHSYHLLIDDFVLGATYTKFIVLIKTTSRHLNYKILFKNRYYHNILRYCLSPQAP